MTAATGARRTMDLPMFVLGIVGLGLVLLLESQLRLSLRLPGHRAFPGAFALLTIAELVPALPLLVFALVIGGLVALVGGNPWLAGVWLVPAAVLVISARGAWQRRLPLALVLFAGLLFGLGRYLALPQSWHHTPDPLRLGGHLLFGLLGGAAAYGARAVRTKTRTEGPQPT